MISNVEHEMESDQQFHNEISNAESRLSRM